MGFTGTFWVKISMSTLKTLTGNLKSHLISKKKVKISYQKILILDFKDQRILRRGAESV